MIPAFNQGRYVAAAIRSALEQVPPPYEVIVIDDGSTDETPSVIAEFGERVRVIRQENQGLAAARNAGIAAACGTHVAMLDADDEWTPTFAPAMQALIARMPGACAYYGSAAVIDADGRELPQQAGPHVVEPEQMLDQIVRANFLIPSTMVLDRAAVLAAGGFRDGFHGVEDKDLWLRLLFDGAVFVGTPAIVARYRIHAASLSADVGAMLRADRAVVADLFGADAGEPDDWPRAKRRAWAGHHRVAAITALVRAGDWDAAGLALGHALAVDPSLASDATLLHELALGTQPLGWRGTREHIDVRANARALARAVRRAFEAPRRRPDARLRPVVEHAAHLAVADVAWQVGERQVARSALRAAAARRPRDWASASWWRRMGRTLLPAPILAARRALRREAMS